jgi:hypothetical protein
MPKTTVNEYRESLLHENKIRLTKHCLMSSPALDFVNAKDGSELQFRELVAPRPNCRHNLGAFLFTEDVSHFEN